MRNKLLAPNIDNSNPLVYPNGRIKDNTGSGNGTPVNEFVYGDLHEMKDKLMRLYGIAPNDLPDNEVNGFQLIDALRALASKNDFILDLTTVSGVVNIGLKLGFILNKESVVCLSGFDFTTETQIRGVDGVTNNLTVVGSFKRGEYVRLIKTASGVTLIREVDAVNLNLAVSELSYLKKATQTQENAGAIDTVATTPLTNLTAFIRRVNGVESASYLATTLQNGLLSKEDKAIIDGLGTNPVRNFGTISNIDINSGTIGSTYPVTGDLISATLIAKPGQSSTIEVVVANTMTDVNYYVRVFINSQGSNVDNDNNLGSPIFRIINATTFQINLIEYATQSQNLKFFVEVVKI